jgi:hypothetical protein
MVLKLNKPLTWYVFDVDARSLHNLQVKRSTSMQDLSFTTGLKNFKRSFYFPVGKSESKTTLMGSPLCTLEIGLRDFADPVVKRWSFESPKPETVNADPSLSSFGNFPIAISAIAMSRNLSSRLTNLDMLKLRYTRVL